MVDAIVRVDGELVVMVVVLAMVVVMVMIVIGELVVVISNDKC